MTIRILTLVLLSALMAIPTQAGIGLSRLDTAISRRPDFIRLKQQRIDSLRTLLTDDEHGNLDIYHKLFSEFLTFNFDSTITYVDKAERIADTLGDYDTLSRVRIHRALSLATSGHFSHAVSILDRIDSHRLSAGTREEYYSAYEWTYGVWAEYSDKRSIAPGFTSKSLVYLDSLIDVTDRETPEYTYRIAEKNLRNRRYDEAKRGYLSTLARTPLDSRLYAQAAYALAMTYKESGDKARYKEWLINAAISDQTVPLKENLALQQLAMYLKSEEGDLTRANSYLKIALEDAIFYNNRLRMLEIAEKIPDIANVYQDTIEHKNHRLEIYLFVIGFLMVLLGIAVVYMYIQHGRVKKSKDTLAGLNGKLKTLNLQLSRTNRSREQYVSLFMDLCAAYIEKLNRFPTILKLKVRELSDVSSVADRYVRPSEAETKEMFFNFDSAFLRLYPDFITRFNSLLQQDKQIHPKKGELLNTDLRIYALVRMGISDSNKIATLLFLSPQTIFNHRTQVRNRAIDRDSFEKSVLEICPTVPEEDN